MSEASIRLFISYSHRDETLRQQLDKHLAPLKAQKIVEAWHDRQIQAGDEWAGEIDENLNRADIILLLISPDFVASNYCYNIELTQAMQRHETGEAIVVPVIIEPCDWSWLPFAKLQAFPKDGKAVTTWGNQNEAFLDVAMGLRKKAQALFEQRQAATTQKNAQHEQYLKKVESSLADKLISDIERDTLDELRDDLGLTAEEATVLERQATGPQPDREKSLQNYRKTLTRLIEKGSFPFSAEIRNELDARRKDLGLSLEEAQRIETSLLSEVAVPHPVQQHATAAVVPPSPEVPATTPRPTTTPPITYKPGAILQGQSGWFCAVKSVAVSPDGQIIASGDEANLIKLWNRNTGQEIRSLAGHSGGVVGLAFSPDGEWLASGSTDETVKLWQWGTGALNATLSGHSGVVTSVAFSRDGEWLASGSSDNTCRLWEAKTGQGQATIEQSDDVVSVEFSPDNRFLTILSTWEIALYNLDTKEARRLKMDAGNAARASLAISPDGETLAVGTQDGAIELWDVRTGSCRHTFSAHKSSFLDGAIESIAFSPNGEILASGGANNSDKTIKLWNPTTCELRQTLEGHQKGISALAFSPDGQTLISGSYDQTVRIWC